MTEHKVVSLENIKVACKNCSLSSLCLPMALAPEDVERLDEIGASHSEVELELDCGELLTDFFRRRRDPDER